MIDNVKGLYVVDEYGSNGTSRQVFPSIYAKQQLMRALWTCRDDSQTGLDPRMDLVMASARG